MNEYTPQEQIDSYLPALADQLLNAITPLQRDYFALELSWACCIITLQ